MNNNLDQIFLGFPLLEPTGDLGTLDDIFNGFPILISAIDQSVPPTKAIIFSPEDSSENISILTQLKWMDGGNSVEYNVYFDTVNPPVALLDTVDETFYTFAEDLEYETEYFWRIDAVNNAGTTEGDVWSFTTAPLTLPNKAINFSPANESIDQSVQSDLTWEDGGGPEWYGTIPNTYKVYFGTSNPPTFIQNQAGLSYNPGILQYEQLYFWRIDVVNYDGTQIGDVLYFNTAAQTPPGKATDPDPADDALAVAIQQYPSLSWTAGALSDSFDVYVGTVSGLTVKTATVTSPTYTPTEFELETEYFWRIDCVNFDGTTTGDEWSFTTGSSQTLKTSNLNEFAYAEPLKTIPSGSTQALDEWEDGEPGRVLLNPAYGTNPEKVTTPDPGHESTTASIFSILSWEDVFDYANYDVYFGTTLTFVGNQSGKSYDPGQLEYETTYYWRIDPIQEGTIEGDVWSFTTLPVTPPEKAINFSPPNGLTDVAINKTLFWENGGLATSYDVYFGTSNPPAFIGNQAGTSYNPGTLENDTEYFWRIDPVNFDGTTTGDVLSFTTRDLSFFVNPQRRNLIVISS